MMKRKTHILWVIVLSAAAFLSACGNGSVKTGHPVLGSIRDTVDESGTVYYYDNYTITSSVGGRITGCHFDVGDQVERGQTLYTIDDTDIANGISSAEISLKAAKAAYSQAVKAAEELSVKSYLSGMITESYCNAGDYISTGSRIAKVVDSTHLKVRLAYADAGAIALGSEAKISVLGDTSEITGTVTKIDAQNTVFDGRQTGVYVEISFLNPGALKSGETASATINGLAPIANGTVEYGTEDAIYSTGTGLVTSVRATVGDAVSPDFVVLVIKNDAVTNAVTNAGLSLANAEETLRQLKKALDDYTIKAPVSGTVLNRAAKESDIAAPASPLATLSSGDMIHVEVDIDEMYISKVSTGQNAAITLTSDESGTVYNGIVKEISDSGTVTNGVTYYTVKISLDRQDGLMDGMNVDVSIIVALKENCLLVPKSYLINGSQIKVLENGKTVLRDITVGITDNKNAEVISGLDETDSIVSK